MSFPGERIFQLLMLVLALVAAALAVTFASEPWVSSPAVMPLLSSLTMVAALLVLLRGERTPIPEVPESNYHALIVLGAMTIALVLLLPVAGFAPAVFLYLLLSLRLVGQVSWNVSLLVAINVVAVVYLLFSLVFEIVLPEGVWA